MARYNGTGAKEIYEAAAKWRDDCLIGGGSLGRRPTSGKTQGRHLVGGWRLLTEW